MGHLVNPVLFRLSKSKFWISVWNNYNKVNYKKYFIEDLNNYNIFKWLLNIINYKEIGFKFLDLNIIKNFKFFILNLSIIFQEDYIIDVLKSNDILYKRFFFDKFLYKIITKKKKKLYNIGNLKKIYYFNLNFDKRKLKRNIVYIKFYSNILQNFISFKNTDKSYLQKFLEKNKKKYFFTNFVFRKFAQNWRSKKKKKV